MTLLTNRILIIDPKADFAQELAGLLSRKGYDVEMCKGLIDAIQRIKNVKFNCVLMNTKLPEIMGSEAVPVLKAIDPALKIIMMADENTMEIEKEVRKQDVFYYYIKSFDRTELELAVSEICKQTAQPKKP
ncbi:MAG TPA: response regulator [Planctomycetota bacterium]|nr:response regulator [Planctomycetota bacterium]